VSCKITNYVSLMVQHLHALMDMPFLSWFISYVHHLFLASLGASLICDTSYGVSWHLCIMLVHLCLSMSLIVSILWHVDYVSHFEEYHLCTLLMWHHFIMSLTSISYGVLGIN